VTYIASAVKIYNAASILVRFVNKNVFVFYKKTAWPPLYNAGVVDVNFEVVGLAPDSDAVVI
jgi:hypothetical protein